jgi:hypothetical protein
MGKQLPDADSAHRLRNSPALFRLCSVIMNRVVYKVDT